MDELTIINRLQKALKRSVEDISASMLAGGVDNMEKYKYLLGQAVAYQITLQEISNLLNHKEQKDEQGTVIDFGPTKN
jgi:hypothetical protein|tara:strand:+ start:94 stop:327 length:234 start_codon:yes stop_codon:yes gene_type:complete